ncbi:MAG: SDR family oxidoreductase [candidate division Zixibacteria bacterium]|nr:SDR family oxidoreductase [candidate division Zixibacteria bacterium]
MKYLVTGGAGFIGSNIAHELIKRGEQVRIIDNFSTGLKSNIIDIWDSIELIDGDIRDFWTMRDATEGVDYVLHQAALPSVPRSISNPLTSNSVNIDGTLNVLESSRQANVRRVVMASSSSVYGDTPVLPKHEEMKRNPLSPYAVTKMTNEEYARVYYELYGLETVCMRYFNIFGPRQDPNSQYSAVIPLFIMALNSGTSPTVFGNGEQSRDFTYIDNTVSANLLALTAEAAPGKAYNVACGGQFTLNTLLDELRDILGVDTKAKYDPPRQGDILHSFADISKAENDLNYEVLVSFKDGLKKTVNWFLNKASSETPSGGIQIG